MGLFKKNIEERSISYDTLLQSLNTNKVYISKQSIEKLPIIQESIKKICGSIASLPIELIQKQKDRNNIIEDDIRLYLLNVEANNYLTSYNLKYRICEDLLLYGKSYCYIERKGIKIESLHPVDFQTVTEKNSIDKNGIIQSKDIEFTLNNTLQKRNSYEVLIVDTGNKGVLNSSKLLELLIKHDEMLENVIKNISMPSGFLKTEGRLTQNTINKMKESWKSIYAGSHNAAKTIILEEGLSYSPLDIDLNKFQNNETKAAFIEDAQRLFGLFNIKSDSEYLKYCISPLVSCIESALTSQLLLTSEKEKNTKFIFDCEVIDRADEKTRIESISLGLDKGIYTINEARQKLDMANFMLDSQEEFLSISQGKIMLLKDGKVVVPNMGTSLNIDDEIVELKGEENGENI